MLPFFGRHSRAETKRASPAAPQGVGGAVPGAHAVPHRPCVAALPDAVRPPPAGPAAVRHSRWLGPRPGPLLPFGLRILCTFYFVHLGWWEASGQIFQNEYAGFHCPQRTCGPRHPEFKRSWKLHQQVDQIQCLQCQRNLGWLWRINYPPCAVFLCYRCYISEYQ